MEDIKLDVLCFGAHPDDVEIGMAGTIAKMTSKGLKVGIVDFTQAEMSSNGSIEIRCEEAQTAARILGLVVRENLYLKDRELYINNESINLVVDVIRKYRPNFIFSPYFEDRHPDHGNCSKIVKEAFFSSGIKKWTGNESREAYRPKAHFYYVINGYQNPIFTIDITNEIDKKVKALESYKSQFFISKDSVNTPLNNNYVSTIIAREAVIGSQVGVTYAEGFISETSLLVDLSLFEV
jgi:bacillithiol biosynthesis deacetylase BshB1